jgi:hypothetical protein
MVVQLGPGRPAPGHRLPSTARQVPRRARRGRRAAARPRGRAPREGGRGAGGGGAGAKGFRFVMCGVQGSRAVWPGPSGARAAGAADTTEGGAAAPEGPVGAAGVFGSTKRAALRGSACGGIFLGGWGPRARAGCGRAGLCTVRVRVVCVAGKGRLRLAVARGELGRAGAPWASGGGPAQAGLSQAPAVCGRAGRRARRGALRGAGSRAPWVLSCLGAAGWRAGRPLRGSGGRARARGAGRGARRAARPPVAE